MTDVEWEYAKCLVCGQDYPYPKGDGYKPKTCGRFDCLHKYLHPQLYERKAQRR